MATSGNQKGGEKTGGRKKGTPNKNSQKLIDRANELGINPFEILLHFAAGNAEEMGMKPTLTRYNITGQPYTIETIPVELRQKAAKDACEYIYPKRKSIDIKTDGDNPLSEYLALSREERDRRIKALDERLTRTKPKRKRGKSPSK